MANIRPFAALRYARRPDLRFSDVIAPPYDVLDERGKRALQARHPNNIVTIDFPFTVPKTAGPDDVYEQSAITFNAWLKAGVFKRDERRALYPYTQTFEHHGRKMHRRGFIALVRLSPFGQGQVVPHEQTYKGPIEDRLKLMRASGLQLSPIFGLYSDSRHEVANLLYHNAGKPELSGTLDGVQNDLWRVTDAEVENQVIDAVGRKPIYIADGHHRYTTALQYQLEQVQANGGPLPPAHPANWCMFVLVGLQDDGLLILPTHRLVGGLESFDMEMFRAVVSGTFEVTDTPLPPDKVADFADVTLPLQPLHTFGLYDGRTKKLYQLTLKDPDVLRPLVPDHSDAWRRLDVAILQRYLLDEVLRPRFAAAGKELSRGYAAYGREIVPQVDGGKYQLALLLKSTPLGALEQLAKHGEVMPQKSTFFYPKVATGVAINPLR